jgi:hypothetical protein
LGVRRLASIAASFVMALALTAPAPVAAHLTGVNHYYSNCTSGQRHLIDCDDVPNRDAHQLFAYNRWYERRRSACARMSACVAAASARAHNWGRNLRSATLKAQR